MLTKSPSSAPSLSQARWIDLSNPSEAERAEVEHATGLRVPTHAAIAEIESSSRAYVEAGQLYLSSPMLEGTSRLGAALTAVGFVLSPGRLLTVRFGPVAALDRLAASYAAATEVEPSDVFATILEAVVDHAADSLEHASAELQRISHEAFHSERPAGAKLAQNGGALHGALRQLGRMADGISHIRDTLLGIGRITGFVLDAEGKRGLTTCAARLEAVRIDITSLNDYQSHLAGKVQFLLDATLGFISIQQNDIVKTLTVASVVGVPPVLIVGIYGMNFHLMPELAWPLGYPFALLLMVASALAPLAWFKWRHWM